MIKTFQQILNRLDESVIWKVEGNEESKRLANLEIYISAILERLIDLDLEKNKMTPHDAYGVGEDFRRIICESVSASCNICRFGKSRKD